MTISSLKLEPPSPAHVAAAEPGSEDLPLLQQQILDLLSSERVADALERIDAALASHPTHSGLYQLLAKALNKLKQVDAAIDAAEAAYFFAEDPFSPLCQLGDLKISKNDYASAVEHYKKALQIQPDHALVQAATGYALEEQGLLNEAIWHAKRAVDLAPELSYPHYVYGAINYYLGDVDAGIRELERAIQINPNCAKSHTSLGLIRLANLDLSLSTWEHYEWRFQQKQFAGKAKIFSHIPRWDGKLLNHPILIWPEQGLGDAIFSLRFIPHMGLPLDLVTLCIDERIAAMAKRMMPEANVISKWTKAESSLQEKYLSLPLCSAGAYALPRIKACLQPPLLMPDQKLVSMFRKELSQHSAGLKVGVSWFSNRANENGPCKSMDLMSLVDLAAMPGVQLVDLQYGETDREIAEFQESTGFDLLRPHLDRKDDIESLAALILACDYVVTVSNTTAHLAGAVGQKGCVLLPFGKGLTWYWHKTLSTSYWYPTLQLLRQTTFGNWTEPIAGAISLVRELQL